MAWSCCIGAGQGTRSRARLRPAPGVGPPPISRHLTSAVPSSCRSALWAATRQRRPDPERPGVSAPRVAAPLISRGRRCCPHQLPPIAASGVPGADVQTRETERLPCSSRGARLLCLSRRAWLPCLAESAGCAEVVVRPAVRFAASSSRRARPTDRFGVRCSLLTQSLADIRVGGSPRRVRCPSSFIA